MRKISFYLLLLLFFSGKIFANKILCLHGGGGSAASLQAQQGMQDLIEALPEWDFVFASSPISGGIWYNDPPGGGKEPTNDPNWANASISYLDDFIASNGPFDAILGYSQGVPMSLVYLAAGDHNFNKVLLFNGYLPTTHMGLINTINSNSPFEESALLFVAQNDYYFYEIGLEVKNKFSNFIEWVSPTAGHALPTSTDVHFQSVLDFFGDSDSTDTGTDSTSAQSFRLNIFMGSDLNNMQLLDTRIIESSADSQFLRAELVPND